MERLPVVGQLLITIVVIGAVLYAPTAVVVVDGLGGARAVLGPTELLVVVGAGASAATLAALQRIGPAWATRLDVTGRDVARLVRCRQRAAALGVVVGAVVVGALLGVGSHLSGGNSLEVTLVATGAVVVAAVVAWLGQHADRPGAVRALAAGCALLAVGVVWAAAGAVPSSVLGVSCLAAPVLLAGGAPGSLRLGPRRGLRLSGPPPRWSLERAGRFVEALVTCAITTDASAMELLRGGDAAAARRPSRLLATPVGPVPVGVGRRLLAGSDAMALALVAGLGLTAAVAAVVAVVLLGVAAVRSRRGGAPAPALTSG